MFRKPTMLLQKLSHSHQSHMREWFDIDDGVAAEYATEFVDELYKVNGANHAG